MNSRNARFVTLAASAALVVAAVPLLAGCATGRAEADGGPRPTGLVARAAEPQDTALVLGSTDAAELALTASQAFFATAPVVVVAAAGDPSAQAVAAAAAAELTAPVLLVGGAISAEGLRTEIQRLGAVAVVEVGEEATPPGSDDTEQAAPTTSLDGLGGVQVVRLDVDALTPDGELDPRDVDDLRAELPDRGDADVLTEVLVLAQPGETQLAAVATARAAGALPLEVPGGDPRADAAVVEEIASAKALAVVGIGAELGTSEELAWRVRAAESGALLPSGSQLVLPGETRAVVVEADPVTPALEAVPAEVADAALARASDAADAFAAQDERTTVPVVEVAATRLSSVAGEDGDYSTEVPSAALRPFVEAAADAGVHVLLRFEPGGSTFEEQVAEYADLLADPGTGVVLDVSSRDVDGWPEVVGADEVDAAVRGVGEVVRAEGTPQKLVVLRLPEVGAVEDLAGTRVGDGEVAVVVQAVASGYTQRVALWDEVNAALPEGTLAGWTTGSQDPARDVAGVLALDPAPRYVAAP
ncbi:hypothetical protein [Cellulosimicrobium marinum]|uniref:hypothetical protein n=1 Tax=Cellulosimicrobium marinum TaxID=1638992 RepID=UPI001E355395|nr:hypothetical protein [Cellulosimicrobium marinum]MCB7136988.1 hypothetical protein [Cellulosimicrobium marinum]